MRTILQFISLMALIALTLPSVIFLADKLELNMVKWLMLVATIVWFVAATPLMWKDNGADQHNDQIREKQLPAETAAKIVNHAQPLSASKR